MGPAARKRGLRFSAMALIMHHSRLSFIRVPSILFVPLTLELSVMLVMSQIGHLVVTALVALGSPRKALQFRRRTSVKRGN